MERSPQQSVVFVDDDRLQRELASDALAPRVRLRCCASAEEALRALEREPAALVVSDLNMPGSSGLELLEKVRRHHPGTDFILLTANATVESAIGALRMGAADYLRKPVRPQELAVVVERTLERRRLLDENQRLRDELTTVEACRALGACLDPAEVYGVSLELSLRLLERERGFVLYHRSSLPLSHAAESRGFGEGESARLLRILTREKPIPLDELTEPTVLSAGPLHDALRAADLDVGPLQAVPLRGEDQEAALLCFELGPEPLDAAEEERLRIVVGHAALALRNAERYHQAKERAFIDDVTEVYNARYLIEAVERELRRADRYGTDLSVIFIDLDRFKLVNDNHGHLVGSQALRQLSRLLLDCVRQVDTVARYGGDEFTILLADTDEQTALRVAERIRRTVAEFAFEAEPGTVMHLTCSVGVATHPTHGRRREQLLDMADKAMYRAKSQGRDRVCSASDL